MSERPQMEQELAERLATGMFKMTGFDFLSIVYMISAEATQAAVGAQQRGADNQELTESVTDAVNEWMNEQKDFLLGFDTGELPPARLIEDAARRANEPGSEGA